MKTLYVTLCLTGGLLWQGATAQSRTAQQAAQHLVAHSAHGALAAHHAGSGDLRGTAPANDDCTAAQALTVTADCSTPTDGDNTGSTQSVVGPACDPNSTGIFADVWFSFNSGSNANVDVTVVPGTMTDYVVVVLDGCTGTELACAVTPAGPMPVAVTENTDYIVRVYSNTQYGDPGTFTICVSTGTPPPPAPENDECGSVTAQALNVGSPVTFAGTTIGATVTGDYAPGSALDGSGPSVWHAFTITECASVTVAYCGTTPAFGNVWIVLADACPANDLFFFQTWDTTQCGDQNITIFYDSLAAGTYYLPVLVDGTANGPYTILLTATATPEACVVGFDEVAIDARDWSIYPNPGSGVFNLNYNGPSGDVAVELFDATGRRVYNEQRHLNSGTIRSVDLSTLAPGGYNVRLTANGVRTEQRLMVK